MAKLKKAGIISTKEGLEGGYHFETGGRCVDRP
jgi:DNA-binding IscR family transcriptional regulator